jgi:hypothetical protein
MVYHLKSGQNVPRSKGDGYVCNRCLKLERKLKMFRPMHERTLRYFRLHKVDLMLLLPLTNGDVDPRSDRYVQYLELCNLLAQYESLIEPRHVERRGDEKQLVMSFYEQRA